MSKREFFDRHAEGWDEQHTQDAVWQIEKLIQGFDLKKGKRVLDVGCGTGILLSYLSEKVKQEGSVFALDFSWNMIFKAKKSKQKSRILFVNAEVEALPLKEHTFDYVTCLDTFAHSTDQKKAVYEMGRALKKGGKLFIAHTLGKKELAEYHRMAGVEVENDTLPEDDKMMEMMKNAGLKDIEIIDKPNLYLASGKK